MNELTKPSQIEQALAAVETPEEGNFLRRQISAVQAMLGRRAQSFQVAHEGGRLYVEACAKSGEEWAKVRPGQGARLDNTTSPQMGRLRAQDAGFKNEGDATRCVRLAELDAQDRQLYYSECAQNGTIPTMGGAYGVWRMLNEEGEERERHACPECSAMHVVKH